MFESEVEPILQLAAVDYTVFETERPGHAKHYLSEAGMLPLRNARIRSQLSFCMQIWPSTKAFW